MTATFIDFVSQQQAKKDIADAVLKHTHALCEALRQNYIDYSIESHQRQLTEYGGDRCDVSYASYHKEQIVKLKNGESDYEFYIETGRKYHKVMMSARGSKSVHCFIDKQTGEVYKPASIKAPAKGVRYDLRLIEDREYLFKKASWHGGYLYK